MPGEKRHLSPRIQVPPWPVADDPPAEIHHHLPVSGVELAASPPFFLAALQRFVLFAESKSAAEVDEWSAAGSAPAEFACCDEFRMYGFKVWRCPRGRGAHDWTACPFAHPGEKARRRDPRRVAYDSAPCPEYRREGRCCRGEACGLAHGVFETWLHPDRYRTQRCRDGPACRRRVCFFAHSPEELRSAAPGAEDVDQLDGGCSSPYAYLARKTAVASPTSTLEVSPFESPPSPSPLAGSSAVGEVVESMRRLELGKGKEMPRSWGFEFAGGGEFGLTRRVGGCLVPAPATAVAGGGAWRPHEVFEASRRQEATAEPDLGWVSELVS